MEPQRRLQGLLLFSLSSPKEKRAASSAPNPEGSQVATHNPPCHDQVLLVPQGLAFGAKRMGIRVWRVEEFELGVDGVGFNDNDDRCAPLVSGDSLSLPSAHVECIQSQPLLEVLSPSQLHE